MKSHAFNHTGIGSPRRRELLRQLAVDFEVAAADIDESVIDRAKHRGITSCVCRAQRPWPDLSRAAAGCRYWVLTPSCCWMVKFWASPESRAEAERCCSVCRGGLTRFTRVSHWRLMPKLYWIHSISPRSHSVKCRWRGSGSIARVMNPWTRRALCGAGWNRPVYPPY